MAGVVRKGKEGLNDIPIVHLFGAHVLVFQEENRVRSESETEPEPECELATILREEE